METLPVVAELRLREYLMSPVTHSCIILSSLESRLLLIAHLYFSPVNKGVSNKPGIVSELYLTLSYSTAEAASVIF